MMDKEKEKVNPEEKCEHEWVYTGHGHNYDVYTCVKCGLTDER